jgi:hypothetical protein
MKIVEELVEWMSGKGNRSTRRKTAPVQLCPPYISHTTRAELEPVPPQGEAGDYSPELRQFQLLSISTAWQLPDMNSHSRNDEVFVILTYQKF